MKSHEFSLTHGSRSPGVNGYASGYHSGGEHFVYIDLRSGGGIAMSASIGGIASEMRLVAAAIIAACDEADRFAAKGKPLEAA